MSILQRHHVNIRGSGERTLLFSHGFGCNQDMFRFIEPAFREEYRTVVYDLAGSGRYPSAHFDPSRYRELEDYARDLINISEAARLRNVVVVGHSVSAMIGAIAAIRRPDLFEAVVMIGPSPRYIDEPESGYRGGFSAADIDELLDTMSNNYLGWSQLMALAFVGNPERPELGEELAESFCATDPELARHFAEITFRSDHRADLPKVPVPTLVIQTTEDIVADEAVGRYVADRLPRADFELIDARGHCPNLSAPQPTVAAIQRFLASTFAPA